MAGAAARGAAPPPSPDGLRRAISLPSAVLIVMGGVIGVGVFVNPAVVARSLPSASSLFLVWAAGGLMALLGAVTYAELAARFPETGGEYVYLREAFGPLAAFLFGWTTLLVVHTGGLAAVALIFSRNLEGLVGRPLPQPLVAVSVLAAMAGVNVLGVGPGARLQGGLGVLKLVVIGAAVALGFLLAPAPGSALAPPAPSPDAWGAALVPVVFSFGGWQTANYVAGEMRRPGDLGVALVLGVLGVTLVYLAVVGVCVWALGPAALGRSASPVADVLARALGPAGGRFAAGAIALSALAFISQGVLTGPRVIFAMSRDGAFPSLFGRATRARGAPAFAVVLVAVWTAVLALSGTYERILSYVTAMNFLFFGVTGAGLFVLRRRNPGGSGFRSPGHPLTTVTFILACALVVTASVRAFPADSLMGFVIMLLGIPAYLLRRRTPAAAAP